jgi:hypothetical protein
MRMSDEEYFRSCVASYAELTPPAKLPDLPFRHFTLIGRTSPCA